MINIEAGFSLVCLPVLLLTDIAPYKTVLTHGYVVDANGRKMSKSLGNGVDPKLLSKVVKIRNKNLLMVQMY